MRRRLRGFGKRFGAYIFGSFAARTDTPDSDVDVLLVGEMDRDVFNEDFWRLELRLGRPVNVVTYGWEDFRQRVADGSPFLRGLLAQPLLTVAGQTLAGLVEAATSEAARS